MKKIYKTVIIGGGASGLLCAVELLNGEKSLNGQDVLILERNDRVGKKILATGNGQGNLTNADILATNYYGEKNFIKAFFDNSYFDLEEYFYNIKIPLITEENGKKYPMSMQASSFLDIVRENLEYNKCETVLGQKVVDIKRDENKFIILTDKKEEFYAENVVLAVGGKASKQFGTDGTSYILAENFGHKCTLLSPSLVQLKTETESIRGLKGLKEKVSLTLLDGDKIIKKESGDLLFTEYGVSGDSVFKISSSLNGLENAYLKVEFLPDFSKEKIAKIIKDRNMPDNEVYLGLINKKIGQAVLKTVKVKTVESYVNALKDFRLKIKGTLGFDFAQVTKGGIDTNGINPFTMQSKLQKGLYLTGEYLNVDGDCGGYNLTFAFVSGITAAKNIKNNY